MKGECSVVTRLLMKAGDWLMNLIGPSAFSGRQKILDRGRDHHSGPPAQIPACGSIVLGSCLGFWRRSARPKGMLLAGGW